MKPLLFMNIKYNNRPAHSRRSPISLYLIFLGLTLFWNPASANSSPKKKISVTLPPTNCAVCDSLVNANCSRDDTLLPSFNQTCGAGQTWCYKSEGSINTFDDTGERIMKDKVDRGCAKPYFETVCVQIRQELWTDFKICYCAESMCNWNYSIPNQTAILDQTVVTSHATRLGELFWLIPLSLLCMLRWTDC